MRPTQPTRRRLTLPPAILAVAGALLLAAAAGAAGGHSFSGLPAGARTLRGSFSGSITVVRFAASGKRVIAVSRVTGVLRDTRYPGPERVDERAVALPVGLSGGGGSCSRLTVTLGPAGARLFGLYGTLSEERVAIAGSGQAAKTACALNGHVGATREAALLESLRKELHG